VGVVGADQASDDEEHPGDLVANHGRQADLEHRAVPVVEGHQRGAVRRDLTLEHGDGLGQVDRPAVGDQPLELALEVRPVVDAVVGEHAQTLPVGSTGDGDRRRPSDDRLESPEG
jgi:hypothetical protein